MVTTLGVRLEVFSSRVVRSTSVQSGQSRVVWPNTDSVQWLCNWLSYCFHRVLNDCGKNRLSIFNPCQWVMWRSSLVDVEQCCRQCQRPALCRQCLLDIFFTSLGAIWFVEGLYCVLTYVGCEGKEWNCNASTTSYKVHLLTDSQH